MTAPNYVAGSAIQPSRFVVADPAASNQVFQASGTAGVFAGVAQEWSKFAPTPGFSAQAADVGDSLKVYGLGDICLLQATSAGWLNGDRITSDSAGNGIKATGSTQYGAVALGTVASAGLGRVQVQIGKNP